MARGPENERTLALPLAEAIRVFETLAAELEEGRGDPDSVFAAHPAIEDIALVRTSGGELGGQRS